MRNELTGTFEKALVGGHYEASLLTYHLEGVFEQLDLLFPQPNSLTEGHHFVLLLQEEELNTGQVRFAARLCDCGGYGYGCSLKAQ